MLQQQLAEVGSTEGHLCQEALATRLAVAVSVPWSPQPMTLPVSGTVMGIDGGAQPTADSEHEQQYAAAAARVDTIGEYAWQMLFHTGVSSSRMIDIKCAGLTLW